MSEGEDGKLVVAWVGACLGPTFAVLHETDLLSIGPSATLWPVGVVALGALAGLLLAGAQLGGAGMGTRALALLPNVAVLGLYGFLLLFFGLGGSR